ncbi:aminopeptidase M1-A-like [Harpegnathos saltator]|uniref:aminopeptidase M1-A-like n=1 Tax=Harpegnathos saltator TaxID=610380 RepID=UPI000DBEDEEC|nr:aminopeptidase M1-A-like [Harpegnathos saltator]
MSLRNICMASLILLLSYILLCAANETPETIDTDYDQSKNMQNCASVSPYNELPVHNPRPTRYTINFDINPNFNRAYGVTNIMITVENPTRDISLHAYGLRIVQRWIFLTAINTFSVEKYAFIGYRYCKDSQILDLRFDKIIVAGTYNLTIHFNVIYSPRNNIVKYTYQENGNNHETTRLFITRINAARRIFPCWDEPGLKAIFNISVKHPRNVGVISNMPMILKEYYDQYSDWIYFEDTPLISPFNIFIALLETTHGFALNPVSKIDFIWHMEIQDNQLIDAINTITLVDRYLTSITNLPNILPRRNYMLFPNNTIKTMEYFGFVIYSEKDAPYNEHFDFPGRKIYIDEVISHQMARQPFIVVATQSRWADLWLGESLLKLYSHYVMNEIYSGLQLMDLYTIQILQSTFRYETTCRMQALSEYNVQIADEIDAVLCSPWYYNKGYALLRMIECIITRDEFQLAVRRYLDKFKFRSATLYDFWIILQRMLDNRDNQLFNIKEIMDTWLTKRYYPVMQVFYDSKNNIVRLNITGSVDMMKSTWMIPITCTI